MKIIGKVETKYIDPLSRKAILIGDRVTVGGPSGALVDLRVMNIDNEKNTIVLGPLSEDSPLKPLGKSVLASPTKEGFQTKSGSMIRKGQKIIILTTDNKKDTATIFKILQGNIAIVTFDGVSNLKAMGLIDRLLLSYSILVKDFFTKASLESLGVGESFLIPGDSESHDFVQSKNVVK